MNMIKRTPLISKVSVVLLIVMLISATTFGGTYSWFVNTIELVGENETPLTNGITGTMGEVVVELTENTITNTSTIPIILRVRVIPEWVQDGETMGTPPSDITIGCTDPSWEVKTNAQGGIFLVYTGGEKLKDGSDNETIYGIIQPDKTSIQVPEITTTQTETGWTLQITLIAEALQATANAYEYTKTTTPGVTSWALN